MTQASRLGSLNPRTQKSSQLDLAQVRTQDVKKSPLGASSLRNYARCLLRFEELKKDYPDEEMFFENNKSELLSALQDCKTERELRTSCINVEPGHLQVFLSRRYQSSSIHATEDAMLELLDAKRLLDVVITSSLIH